MKIKKSDKIKVKLTVDEALKMRKEFGELAGVTDDMVIVEFMERIDMVT